ncbi:hypothetical protein Tco_0469279 [Tanacetum coccineum]
MVAFLSKPQGSDGFHQIVDFLKASHIRYALTETPTIYVSLINQFWCTTSVRTLDNGEIELIAIVYGQEKSIMKHLSGESKLAMLRLGLKGYLTYLINHHSEKIRLEIGGLNSKALKAVYNKSLITLTKRVKKLENKLKLKRRSTIVNSSEDEEASLDIEDPSKQAEDD